ncbi:C40 family peptidase [Thomasclavelia sp.]|uniref:C40 family peptidase n=1 Tax=Thomasclavelia sp. TaxID=3025757 RepID=UPI0025FF40F2|nr:C40 family peptidase [Thomasclavelia sp.]
MNIKKVFLSTITAGMLIGATYTPAKIEATNFAGQEDKYMELCSSSNLSSSNLSKCKEFNTYLKQKNKDLQSSINSSKDEISKTQTTLDGVISQIATLNNQIQEKQNEIEYLQTSIKNLEDSITKKEEEIKNRMYSMQSYNNSNTYVEFIFGASNFSDFFARVDSVNEITSYDEDLITEIADEKNQVETQKATVETAKANIESQKKEQESLQSQYQALLSEQQNQLASAEKEQEKISSTQSSLDSFLSSIIINNSSSNSGSGGGSYTPSENIPTTNKYGSIVVSVAKQQLGKPYVWGASGPNSFDCSGLVMYCYAQAGVSLDHYSGSQKESGAIIPVSEAQPGDILWKSGHVGIYIGGGQYIHAPQTGDVVKIASNVGRFTCAVRPY